MQSETQYEQLVRRTNEVEVAAEAYRDSLTEDEIEAGTVWVTLEAIAEDRAAWLARYQGDPFAGQSPRMAGESDE